MNKSDNESWKKIYNCDLCCAGKDTKKRECFLFDSELEIPITEFEEDGKPSKKESKYKTMNKEVFFEEIARVHSILVDVPLITLVTGFYGNLCPQSLLSAECAEVVSLENAVSRYHQLPFPGSYLEQPHALIEAFEIVRGAIISFENDKIKNIKTESTNQPKTGLKKK